MVYLGICKVSIFVSWHQVIGGALSAIEIIQNTFCSHARMQFYRKLREGNLLQIVRITMQTRFQRVISHVNSTRRWEEVKRRNKQHRLEVGGPVAREEVAGGCGKAKSDYERLRPRVPPAPLHHPLLFPAETNPGRWRRTKSERSKRKTGAAAARE